jgi:Gram-negative bacterial TonB protein C-terminal
VQKLIAADYPLLAQWANIQGSVELTCAVGSEGLIVECTATSGHALLQQAAIQNAKKWLFRRQNGSDTDRSQVLLHYEFVLLDSKPVRTRPKVEFAFEFPNSVRIVSETPCPDHLPCTPEELEKFQKQQPKKSKRFIPQNGVPHD